MCDPSVDYPIKWMLKLKNDKNGQVIEEGRLTSRIDLDNNILETIKIYSLEDKEWMFVLGKEDFFCDMQKNFFGELATVLEKAAGLEKTCPYPKGTHKVSNFPIDWSKLKFKDIPDGVIKLTIEYNNVKTNDLLGCLEVELTCKK
nr:uncharacterized protein LOC111515662 [Leptinotarsa decemlineata]